MKKLNFNEEVYIKITPFGYAILKNAYDNGDRNVWFTDLEGEFVLPMANEEDYSQAPLWKVMKYFGPYLQVGSHKVPFENVICIAPKGEKGKTFQKEKKIKKEKSIHYR